MVQSINRRGHVVHPEFPQVEQILAHDSQLQIGLVLCVRPIFLVGFHVLNTIAYSQLITFIVPGTVISWEWRYRSAQRDCEPQDPERI